MRFTGPPLEDALDARDRHYHALFDALPAAIYTTDARGRITFYNKAAIAFSGRRPQLGSDAWCISWRLYDRKGNPMPHDACPMAVALREDRPIQGDEAIAERPDGTRVPFAAYPTPIHDSAGRLIGAVNMLIDLTERKAMEQQLRQASAALETRVGQRTRELAETIAELRESERSFRLLVEGVTDYAIFMLDTEGRVSSWNSGAERIKGYRRADILDHHFSVFYSEEDQKKGIPRDALSTARRDGRFAAEGWRLRKDGSRFWANTVIDAIHDEAGTLIGFAKITRDMTEQRAIEEQLRQAQKMEAIGQLTGGVAHDFNNLLAVIILNMETMRRRLGPETMLGNTDLLRTLESTLRAAQRATTMTRQLLAFGRRQSLDPQWIDPRSLVRGMTDLLRRTLGERIAIENKVAGDGWAIFADENQLETALLNLAVNARDAMPRGGTLTIRTANVDLAGDAARARGVAPGHYVALSVTDTGTGMAPETVAKAFEPFFTTKEVGRGSGLGLAQVYGFVKQSGGHAVIESELGIGTTVTLLLPRCPGEAPTDALQSGLGRSGRGRGQGERILLVEDNDDLRVCYADGLREVGYDVIEAADGETALALLDDHPNVALLFTDVGLPGRLDGIQLAEKARQRRPRLKILFATGYAQPGLASPRKLDGAMETLCKPFPFKVLAEKVRAILDGKTRSGAKAGV